MLSVNTVSKIDHNNNQEIQSSVEKEMEQDELNTRFDEEMVDETPETLISSDAEVEDDDDEIEEGNEEEDEEENEEMVLLRQLRAENEMENESSQDDEETADQKRLKKARQSRFLDDSASDSDEELNEDSDDSQILDVGLRPVGHAAAISQDDNLIDPVTEHNSKVVKEVPPDPRFMSLLERIRLRGQDVLSSTPSTVSSRAKQQQLAHVSKNVATDQIPVESDQATTATSTKIGSDLEAQEKSSGTDSPVGDDIMEQNVQDVDVDAEQNKIPKQNETVAKDSKISTKHNSARSRGKVKVEKQFQNLLMNNIQKKSDRHSEKHQRHAPGKRSKVLMAVINGSKKAPKFQTLPSLSMQRNVTLTDPAEDDDDDFIFDFDTPLAQLEEVPVDLKQLNKPSMSEGLDATNKNLETSVEAQQTQERDIEANRLIDSLTEDFDVDVIISNHIIPHKSLIYFKSLCLYLYYLSSSFELLFIL